MSINNERAAPGATGSGSLLGSVNWGLGGLDYGEKYRGEIGGFQALKALRRDFPLPLCDLPIDHPDTLLVLQTLNGARLTKRIRADGSFTDYDRATLFAGHVVDVSTLAKLHALLQTLGPRWDCAIVHGRVVEGVDLRRMYRRSVTPPVTLVDHRRNVFALDVDAVAQQPGLDPRELELCAAYARSLLPPAFRRAGCVAVATSGHCIKDGLRFRFWFRLPKPLKCAELKRLLQREHAPVDVSPLHACGLAYTASPIFDNPDDDPLPDGRLVMLDGDSCATTPDAEVLKPPPVPSYRPPPRMQLAPGGDPVGLVLNAMQAIEATPPGARHDRIMREANELAKWAVAGVIDAEQALSSLIHAGTKPIKGAREIKPQEVIQMWQHALRNKSAEQELERSPSGVSYADDEEDAL
jgi:hypothetical protein